MLSTYGQALQERREVVGYKSQPDIAAASVSIAREFPELFDGFSQQWVSRLESDETGERILNAKPRQLRTLAYLLKWGADEFTLRVGISIGKVPLIDSGTHPRQASVTELEDPNLSPVYAIADAHRPVSYQTKPLEDLQIWVKPSDRRPGLKLFAASGHSMDNGAEKAIKDGFVLFVDTHSRDPRDGAIYVIHVHGDGNCVKRARVLGGQFWLFSDNSDQGKYPPFQPDEADIIGLVYMFQPPPQKL